MLAKWVGKRRSSLRLMLGRHISELDLRQAAALLHAPRAVVEGRMAATLTRVQALALQSPVYASGRNVWDRIHGLEDLSTAPYTSSDLLPAMSAVDPDWSKWVTAGERVIAAAATSGSTGRSKLMPYTQSSLEAYVWSAFPHIAHITLERALPVKPLALALSAPEGYISHLVIPHNLTSCGYDVLHVPLASLLNDPGVAQDLVDWILEPSSQVHAICAVTAMIPMLIAVLEEQSGGPDALEKIRRSLRFLHSGGSELTPALEAMISTRLGLPPGSYVNLFASTEGGMVGSSQEDFSVFHASFHSHVLSIIPLEEVAKAESDPSYHPKSVLLTRAAVGLVGELACVFEAAVPWLNLRQGDIFEVIAPLAGSDVPRLRHLARMSSMHDVAGGRVWPASYQRAMGMLGSKVTDYLAMALKPGERLPANDDPILVKDKLLFYYEGTAGPAEVAAAIFDSIPILVTAGPLLGAGSFDMQIVNVKPGALRRCRQRKSFERGGAPGPLKEKVVRGPQYQIPAEDVVASAPGWIPRERDSGISAVTSALKQDGKY